MCTRVSVRDVKCTRGYVYKRLCVQEVMCTRGYVYKSKGTRGYVYKSKGSSVKQVTCTTVSI